MKMHLGLALARTVLAGVIALGISGCNQSQDTSGGAKSTTTVGTEIDDSILTGRVAAALLSDLSARSYGFKVETRKGDVQLSGFADNQADIERAVQVARGVPGVKQVDNKVSVKTAATTVGNKVDDGIVTARIKAALLSDSSVRGFDIGVVTQKGEVQLSGFAATQAQIDRAVEIARGVEGVRAVDNKMTVKQ
ncbi:MAG: hypothetical protein JWN94_1564 [Betaproteobacteria bacterium]|nr:hypothetical protein [Betaproteobacteria bacterium]